MITLQLDTSAWGRLANLFGAAGRQAPVGIARGINRVGLKARTLMRRSLVAQTGLRYGVFVRALQSRNASPGSLRFEIIARGGNVRLKFFRPRESRRGVTAFPWNRATVYPGAFTKGGRFPRRVPLRRGGNVFKRVGAARLPIKVQRSGLFIPDEMISGSSFAAFDGTVASELPEVVARELLAILAGLAPAGRV